MKPRPLEKPDRIDWWLAGGLLIATLAAYLPVLNAGAIWDDDAHITRLDLGSWPGLARIWFEPGATQQYYPIVHSAFWLEHRLWGDAPLGYHLLNVGLHGLAACLLARVLLMLGDGSGYSRPARRVLAWGAAALFALHPVAVESVAWISEQKNTLSAVFYLAAAGCYLRFDERRRGLDYAIAAGLFLLAVLSKSVTATLPAALLLAVAWKRKQLEWRRDVTPLLPWLVVGVAGGLGTAWIERHFIGAAGTAFALTGLQRSLLAGRILWFYLGKLLWPANLIFIYPHWTVDPGRTVWYVPDLGVLALTGLMIWRARRGAWGSPLALLYFAGTLFPALGFVNVYPFIFSYVADHFQYLASIGVFLLIAGGAAKIWEQVQRRGRAVLLAVGAAGCVTLAGLTWAQAEIYCDSETLYRATLARNPGAWLADLNLGSLILERGQVDEAVAAFRRAEKLEPDYPTTHFNLARVLLDRGDLPAAITEFEEDLRLNPGDAEAANNLGIALAQTGRNAEAEAALQAAVRLRPAYAVAWGNLGVVQLREGRSAAAQAAFEKALALDPNSAAAQQGLAQLRGPGPH